MNSETPSQSPGDKNQACRSCQESRSAFREVLDSILAGIMLLLLAVSAVSINLVQMGSLAVRPFSKGLFREINLACVYVFWKFCLILVGKIYGVETILNGEGLPAGETAILFCNHQQMPDILALLPLADRSGQLANTKWFAKESIKYVPGIGWGMLFLDCIFLKRDWTADAGRIRQTFSRLIRNQAPFWLITFSEGTRITPAKLKRSQDYARRAGLPVLQNVMLPKTRGFVASVNGLKECVTAVYDVTIAYEPGIPSIWQLLKGRLKKIHLHVRRFPLSELPVEEKALGAWLIQRFVEKDALLERFHSSGKLE
jgi:1-acyl-sn-glycerol-3-phosphate acyltransferase